MLEENIPAEFIVYLQYCRKLDFSEKPDYSYLRALLLNLFKEKKYSIDNRFEWNDMQYNSNI